MKKTSGKALAKLLRIRPTKGLQAVLKAQLIGSILAAAAQKKLTHAEIAKRSGVPRSAVTGILSGSLQKVTVDRILSLLEAVDLTAEIKIKRAA